MKLRFKYEKKFQTVTFKDTDITINKLIESAAEKYDLNVQSIEISLNAKEYFKHSEENIKANEIGIVNGDILYVKLIGNYVDIKNLLKEEISLKLEDIILKTGSNFHTNILKKLILPIHLFMTETGFIVDEFFNKFMENIDIDIVNNICRLKYVYFYNDTALINLTITMNNTYTCVYGSYCNSSNVYKYLFKAKQFIMQNQFDNTTYQAEKIYKNLMLFSTRFKNQVAVPLRIDIHMDHSISSHPFFQILPFEILGKIFQYLDRKSLLSAMTTCKRLNLSGKMCGLIWKKSLMKTPIKNTLENLENDLNPCGLYEQYLKYRKENTVKKRSNLVKNVRNPVYL